MGLCRGPPLQVGPGAFDPPGGTWQGWLVEMGLWDRDATTQAMELRYQRFRGMSLGMVPREQWRSYLPQLLPYEEMFWYG